MRLCPGSQRQPESVVGGWDHCRVQHWREQSRVTRELRRELRLWKVPVTEGRGCRWQRVGHPATGRAEGRRESSPTVWSASVLLDFSLPRSHRPVPSPSAPSGPALLPDPCRPFPCALDFHRLCLGSQAGCSALRPADAVQGQRAPVRPSSVPRSEKARRSS